MPANRVPLPPEALAKRRSLMAQSCVPGQTFPNGIVWSKDMDDALEYALEQGVGWKAAAAVVGVDYETAMRRWDATHPGQPRPYAKRGPKKKEEPRANAAPPVLTFVSAAQFKAHSLHATQDAGKLAHAVEHSTQGTVHVAHR